MKVEDIAVGQTYTVRVETRDVMVRVDKINKNVAKRSDDKEITSYTFECTEVGKKKARTHIVRSCRNFLSVVERKPKPGDLVRVFKGKMKESLGSETLYRVKEVKGRGAVIVGGKKEHRVSVSDIRVHSEGEQGPDPTAPIAGTSSRMGTSRGAQSTSAPTANGRDAKQPSPALVEVEPLVEEDGNHGVLRLNPGNQRVAAARGVETTDPESDISPDRSFELPPPRNLLYGPGDDELSRLNRAPKRGGLAAKLKENVHKSTDDAPHLIVEARAGTGKTTTLIEGLKRVLGIPSTLTPSPQQAKVWEAMELSKGRVNSIAFCAFNKSIATELQSRVPCGVMACTMHSMGFKAIRGQIGNVRVESYRVNDIIAELLERDIRELRRDERMAAVMSSTEKLVGLCKMNLVLYQRQGQGPMEVVEEELDRLAAHYDIELDGNRDEVYALVPRVIQRCMDVRADMQVDFNDMIWLPVVLNLPLAVYDLLLVDEAQDMNRCQQALAKRAGRRLILCGDAKQAIYGFAGADTESLDRMAKELGSELPTGFKSGGDGTATFNPARGCIRLPLTVTRRCGRVIVEEAKKIVPDFEGFEGNGEGLISRMKYPQKPKKVGPPIQTYAPSTKKFDTDQEPEILCDMAEQARWEKEELPKIEPNDYMKEVKDGDFIVCRVNAPLVSQCFRFLKEGRRATIQGRDIGQGLVSLVKKMKAGDVTVLMAKLSDWYYGEQRKENAKRNPSEARMIALGDKYDCLIAFTEGASNVDEVIRKIEQVFVEDRNAPGIRLSSIHRAKGLEAERVFFLMPEGCGCPHPMARTPWQLDQEWNLKYVAITRAIKELIYVT